VQRVPQRFGHRRLAEAHRHGALLDHRVGAVGGTRRIGPGLAGDQLDGLARNATPMGVPVLGRRLAGAQLVGVVEGVRTAVGHQPERDRLAGGLVLGAEQVGGLVGAGRRLAVTARRVVVVASTGRHGQERCQGGDRQSSLHLFPR
jgi:hypothetical protein